LTGNAKIHTRAGALGFSLWKQAPRQYFAIDGGSGAHLLAALAERSPYLKEVASPRHANVLLIIEPISAKLVPAVLEVAKALARPAHALLLGEPRAGLDGFSGGELVRVEELVPGARRISEASVETVLDTVLQPEQWPELAVVDHAEPEQTISLPSKQEQELATELIVLSLGPIQPFTAGPLRLFLICDGEQVLSVQVESGYAYRGIDKAMMQADWQDCLTLASHLDPLAPIAGQLAYVRAIDQLQQWQPPTQVVTLREAALALERTQNVLWWLVRFTKIVADEQFLDRSYRLATAFADYTVQLWQHLPVTWILPQRSLPTPAVVKDTAASSQLRQIADNIQALRTSLERNRFLGLRIRGIGELTGERLKEAGVSGPVLQGSEHGSGDVQSRLVARLQSAADDVHEIAKTLAAQASVPIQEASWEVPAGEATVRVKGPRGDIGLHLVSSGTEKPSHIEWRRPSAAVHGLLPELLVGQKLADAEVIVASLDLAMAEADG